MEIPNRTLAATHAGNRTIDHIGEVIKNRDAPAKEIADALLPSLGINWPSEILGKCVLHRFD